MQSSKSNKIKYLAILAGMSCAAHASPAPRGSTFPATVDDGTPKVIHSTTPLEESSEEMLGDDTIERSKEHYVERTREHIVQKQKPKSKPETKSVSLSKTVVPASSEDISAHSENEASIPVGEEFIAESAPKIEEQNEEQNEKLTQEMMALRKMNQELADRLSQIEASSLASSLASSNSQKEVTKKPVDPKLRTAGEKVPQNKITDVSERLKYANEIIKRFGIAYDYRSMTLKDFKRILAKLEAKEKSNSSQNQNTAEN